ncbi:MAG: hypothetical protein EOO61_03080 [Hymenobacter sp.]|nr:MAG: hypothetical protein EOO61_03080 [Hymenobacter sp.]
MDLGSLPSWAQAISYIIGAIGVSVIGLYRYFKTEAKADTATVSGGSSSVISASFLDSKLLKELVEALREHQDESGRDAKKLHRLLQDLKEALNELNESTIVQTDTTMNLVRFINRGVAKDRIVDVVH